MDREQRFLKVLELVRTWRDDRSLLLFDAEGVEILRLSRDQQ